MHEDSGGLILSTDWLTFLTFYHFCFNLQDQLNHLKPPQKVKNFVAKFIEERLTSHFICVHWRMEKSVLNGASQNLMKQCAVGLVNSVKRLQKDSVKYKIFVATDISPKNEYWFLLPSPPISRQKL